MNAGLHAAVYFADRMLVLRSERRRMVAGSLLAVFGVMALASSLSTVELADRPNFQFANLEDPFGGGLGIAADAPSGLLAWLTGVIRIVFFALLPPSLLYLLVSPDARRRVVIQVLSLLLISQLILSFARSLEALPQVEALGRASAADGAPPQQAVPAGEAPRALIAALSGVLALALVVGLARAVRRRSDAVTVARRSLQEALASLDRDPSRLESVIYQAYRTLCQASEEHRGIRRRFWMTPREYRMALESAPLPREHLSILTSLFERVRYGGEGLSPDEERAARTSLGAILREIERS